MKNHSSMRVPCVRQSPATHSYHMAQTPRGPVGYTVTEHQRALLRAWVAALGKVMFPAVHTFSVDFHPTPTGVIQRGSIATTFHAAARPVPVSRLSLLWSKKAVVYATPTPIWSAVISPEN